mmetsp:Transcript_7542/g.11190  ORF Transcript_7542/g.11190 Transcript_7542/m.11190 type:complete len:196 (+) Transcript_7542:75-662(+)
MKESLGIKQMQREIINELSKLITCLIHQYLYASQIYPKHTFENKIYEGHVKVPISKSQILKKYIQNQVESLKDHFNVLSNLEIQQYEKELNPHSMEGEEQEASQYRISFHIFLKILEKHRYHIEYKNNDQDMLDAFVAMGGNIDKTGFVKSKHVKEVCQQFNLTCHVGDLLKSMDPEGNGKVRYEAFKKALSTQF